MSTTGKYRVGLIGPLPPPYGGMANQTVQLQKLLRSESIDTHVVQVNRPYKPNWIRHIKGVRALIRMLYYLADLWLLARKVDVFHVMANSGWSWHLFAAPAIWMGWLHKKPVIVNYRGGQAEQFFQRSFRTVLPSIKRASLIVVPSGFLQKVFADRNVTTQIVPNIINLEKFSTSVRTNNQGDTPHIIVTRNLEPIYDIATAIRAFRRIKQSYPKATLTIAGEGPSLSTLTDLTSKLNLTSSVVFAGRLTSEDVATLYRSADVMLNPSLADNMPNSVLEAFASGVAVVSTDVGGIPYVIVDGVNGLLVKPGAHGDMAAATLRILSSTAYADELRTAGYESITAFSWENVRDQWLKTYADAYRQ